ncbi:MAG: 3-phosphoshikimate 1-carboxyvinyltransferase [Clostridia bacterium]|nr:3-phosphoshikimate 1-carboxyvinyltransferase [Clostridia bacterium]
MKVTIKKSIPQGVVTAPPSKSMAHRLLICAGLCRGRSVVHGIAPSEDVLATLDCLGALGAVYVYEGDSVTIDGIGAPERAREPLRCRESGSTLRFFLPLCMLGEQEKHLYGSERLLSRPLDVYREICSEQGISFECDGERVCVCGKLSAGEYSVRGNVSSQFITGLLFALPLLDGDSRINIIPPIESLSYINLTIEALRLFGVEADFDGESSILVRGGQSYQPREVTVEGDYSNAAFFSALRALGFDVSVEGLREDSLQGDRVYARHFEQLERGTAHIDISDCPDLAPILFAFAAARHGGVFDGTRRLAIKESDRGAAMAEELSKMGAHLEIEEDRITVRKGVLHSPSEVLCSHNDHRIVMSLSVLLTLVGGRIDGAEAVSKSMPDFFDRMQELGVSVEYETV